MKSPKKPETVVVLGASDKRDRYSNQAVRLLREHGHHVIPVHPAQGEIEGLPAVPSLGVVTGPVETVTVYVNPTILAGQTEALLALAPKRVILNPGTETPETEAALRASGIAVVHACTLVLLHTGQF